MWSLAIHNSAISIRVSASAVRVRRGPALRTRQSAVALGSSLPRTPQGACSVPARARVTPSSLPDTNKLCSEDDAAAVRYLRAALCQRCRYIHRNTAIFEFIIDFDTFSHARMHTAAVFKLAA